MNRNTARNLERLGYTIAAIGLSLLPQSAFAEDAPIQRSCPELGNTYVTATVTNANAYIPFGPVLRSGPGGTVTATQQVSYTSSVRSSISGNISVGEIVSATVSAGISDAKSSVTSTSYTYSHPISNGKYGNMQWIHWAANVNVKKTVVVSPCNFSQIASGTATVPRNSWGYRYWEN